MQLLSSVEVKRITKPGIPWELDCISRSLVHVRGHGSIDINGETRWDVSLGEARNKANEIRAKVKAGNDPVAERE